MILSQAKARATLLDKVRRIMGMKHDSVHTEHSYCDWIKRFVKFHRMIEKQALFEVSEAKNEAFLSYLATERNVGSDARSGDECAGVFVKCSL